MSAATRPAPWAHSGPTEHVRWNGLPPAGPRATAPAAEALDLRHHVRLAASTVNVFKEFLTGFDHFVLVYVLLLTGGSLLLSVLATVEVLRSARWAVGATEDELFAHPLTPEVTIIVPARNEERHILECARGVLALHYPDVQLIIVDDGCDRRHLRSA